MNTCHNPANFNAGDAGHSAACLEELARAETRAMLIDKFSITAAFVRVPTIAKVLGIAPGTIYASMRNGKFCIAHRLINSTPCVKLDDLVAWYCGQPAEPRRSRMDVDYAEKEREWKRREKINTDRLVADTCAEIGIPQPARRRPRM